VRINLGCGDRYADGWHNVDHAASPFRVDETVDLAGPLPWLVGSVEMVYAGPVLEHLAVQDALDLLDRLRALMTPGGQIMVVGPDVVRGAAIHAAGGFEEWMSLDLLTYGGRRWPGDEHRWACEPALLVDMLKETGWVDVAEIDLDDVASVWPVADRAPRWQCAVGAVAP
jgi:predicted SAM-dependent methyltransferase